MRACISGISATSFLHQSSVKSKVLLYIYLIPIFLGLSKCFFIQEKSTGKYLKSIPRKEVLLVQDIDDATDYETKMIGKNPVLLSIHMRGGDMVFDYSKSSKGGRDLILYPYHGGHNQRFSIILDNQGYYQIVQNTTKFLRYSPKTDSLVGDSYDETGRYGFLLWADNKKTCYAGNLERPRNFSFRRSYKNPLYGNRPSNPFYAIEPSNPFYAIEPGNPFYRSGPSNLHPLLF